MIRCLLVIFFLYSLSEIAYCQSAGNTNEAKALHYAAVLYSKSLSEQAGIYSGPDYIGYPHPVKKGHQFFLSAEPFKGDIYYDGMQYTDVPLWYDLARNEVVAQHYDKYSRINLHPEKIGGFSISGHHFIKIEEAEAMRSGIEKGFYDQIYKGRSEVIVKRSKDFLISTDVEGVWVSFSGEKNTVFLRSGTAYTPVSSQKSVLKALGKYEKEIHAHLKQAKIKFNRERERAIITMVAYYDKLNNPV